jgi:signal peptidase I
VEKNKNKEIIKLIGTIFFFTLSGLLILFILLEAFLPHMTVKVFQFKPYTVITESMEPVINVGDMAIVTNPTNKKLDNLQAGDIITFEADIDYNGTKEVVTHFVFSVSENSQGERIIRTNRYGSTTADPWVLRDQDILGVYAFRIPWIGNLVNFIKSPYGIAAIAVNVLVIGGIIYIVKTGKKEPLVKPE